VEILYIYHVQKMIYQLEFVVVLTAMIETRSDIVLQHPCMCAILSWRLTNLHLLTFTYVLTANLHCSKKLYYFK